MGSNMSQYNTFAQIQWTPNDVLDYVVDIKNDGVDVTAKDLGLTEAEATYLLIKCEDWITAAARDAGWEILSDAIGDYLINKGPRIRNDIVGLLNDLLAEWEGEPGMDLEANEFLAYWADRILENISAKPQEVE
jgi:hypothetical protein